MNKNFLYTVLVLIVGVGFAAWSLLEPPHHDDHGGESHYTAEQEEVIEKGPQGGRLLHDGDFSLEITLFEKGVLPEFHLYSYQNNETLNPNDVSVGD